MCGFLIETLVHLKLVMHVFILLANTNKGQECHFAPCGCLLMVVGCVAARDKVKESTGR